MCESCFEIELCVVLSFSNLNDGKRDRIQGVWFNSDSD